MGFNLKMFFQELNDILNDTDIDEVDMLEQLDTCIQEAKKYAEECGNI